MLSHRPLMARGCDYNHAVLIMYIKTNVTISLFYARSVKVQMLILLVVSSVTTLHLEWMNQYLRISGIAVTVLGTALAFFIGFTNSQAYDRWWEARKIWGALVNDSRSFGRMVLSFFSGQEKFQRILIRRHIGFLYALKSKLRNEDSEEYLAFLSPGDLTAIQSQSHKANAIMGLQGVNFSDQNNDGAIDGFRLRMLNDMLNRFSDSMGKAERIKSTVFPPFYAYLTRISIWAFLVLFTIAISDTVGYWAVLYGYVIGMVYLYTFLSGQAILNPFENRKYDTPITAITRTIEINLLEQLGESDIPEPIEPVDGEYLM